MALQRTFHRTILPASIIGGLSCAALHAPATGQPPGGLWLLPRKDAGNTARADVAGNMKTAPREVWSYGCVTDNYTYLRPIQLGKKAVYLAQVRDGLRLIDQDGKRLWNRPMMGITQVLDVINTRGQKGPRALVILGKDAIALVDVATGKTDWSWTVPAAAYVNYSGIKIFAQPSSTRLVIFPQNSMLGFCFDLTGKPKLLWQYDYTGKYWINFGPSIVLADMDNDKIPEIVLAGKPGYIGVIDINTGAIKFDAQYHHKTSGGDEIGRPYGLLRAADINGDGYKDVVMVSSQVEGYISVLQNQKGKGLKLAWFQMVGLGFPVQEKELCPNVTSLADINGDGMLELVLGLRNEKGDNRWHTIVFNALEGSRIADLADSYFWGCYDVNRDGRPEIITSTVTNSRFAMPAQIQAVDGATFHAAAVLENTSLELTQGNLPDDTAFMATRLTPLYLTKPDGAQGLLVTRDKSSYIWHLAHGRAALDPVKWSPALTVLRNSQGTNLLPSGGIKMPWPEPPEGPAAYCPLVTTAGGRRELILALSDNTIIGGTPDLTHSGTFKNAWTIPGTMPSAWLSPDGKRLVAAADPSGNAVIIYEPSATSAPADPASRIELPWPLRAPYFKMNRSTADLLLYGGDAPLIFAGMQTGATHAVASGTYGLDGKCIWSDSQNGPYPRIAAAADLNNDGQEEIVLDNHGRHIICDAQGHAQLVAAGWNDEIPGRSDGAKYAVPIVGPFGPHGATRIVMAGGLDALETLNSSGNRIAKRNFASCYEFEWCGPAVAKIRSTGEWDVGTVNNAGVFYCNDIETCKTRWTLALGVKVASAFNVSSGDIDGDGRDNFIIGLPNGELLVLDEKNGQGTVLWRKKFDAAVEEVMLADVDGDGLGEIIVSMADGRVIILK